jgi:hypothetical protein
MARSGVHLRQLRREGVQPERVEGRHPTRAAADQPGGDAGLVVGEGNRQNGHASVQGGGGGVPSSVGDHEAGALDQWLMGAWGTTSGSPGWRGGAGGGDEGKDLWTSRLQDAEGGVDQRPPIQPFPGKDTEWRGNGSRPEGSARRPRYGSGARGAPGGNQRRRAAGPAGAGGRGPLPFAVAARSLCARAGPADRGRLVP